jgi:hypothetical protein
MIPSVFIGKTMGNLWSSPKIQPVNGTYLEDLPIRRKVVHSRVASFIPLVEPTPKVAYKEKACRIFHEVALRRQAFTQGTLLQRQE